MLCPLLSVNENTVAIQPCFSLRLRDYLAQVAELSSGSALCDSTRQCRLILPCNQMTDIDGSKCFDCMSILYHINHETRFVSSNTRFDIISKANIRELMLVIE